MGLSRKRQCLAAVCCRVLYFWMIQGLIMMLWCITTTTTTTTALLMSGNISPRMPWRVSQFRRDHNDDDNFVALLKSIVSEENSPDTRLLYKHENATRDGTSKTSLADAFKNSSKSANNETSPPPPPPTSAAGSKITSSRDFPAQVEDADSLIFENLALYEEKERKEMEWMVRTTSRFLWSNQNTNLHHEPNSTNNTTLKTQQPQHNHPLPLTPAQCRRAHLLMKAWARRGATRPDSSKAPQVMERILQRLAEEDKEPLCVKKEVGEQETTAETSKRSSRAYRSKGKQKKKKQTPVVTTRTYNILLDAWSTSRQPGAAERCLEILNEMDRLVEENRNYCVDMNSRDHLRPDTTTFNACIKALVRGAGSGYQQDIHQGHHQQQQPSLLHHQLQHESVVERVQELIDEMKRRQKEQESLATLDGSSSTSTGGARRRVIQIAPDRRTYNLFLYALAHCPMSFANPDNSTATVNAAMNILREMWNQYNCYKEQELRHATLNGFSDGKSSVAASTLAPSLSRWIKPNTNTYNQVIACVARGQESGRFEDHLEELLDEMITLSSSSSSSSPPSFSPSFAVGAQAHEHNQNDNHKDSFSSSLDFSTSVAPNTDSYNGVMGGWLKSRQTPSNSLGRILTAWNRMQHDYHENGNESAHPDRVTLNILLTAYTKFGTVSKATTIVSSHNRTAASFDHKGVSTSDGCALEETLKLWHSFQKTYGILPDIMTFNVLLNSWAKSQRHDAPSQTLQILTFLERSLLDNKGDPSGTAGSVASLTTSEKKKTKKKKSDIPKPNSYSYATYMDCLLLHERQQQQQHYRAGSDGQSEFQVAEQVEAVLRRMQALHRDHGGETPNTSVYNTVINAWAACALASSLSLTTSAQAVKRAEGLLREMLNDPLAPKPNRVTYNTVLKTMKTGRTEDATRAEELLLLLEKQKTSKDNSIADMGPDSYSYTAVISAYARSQAANKAEKVFDLLLRLLDVYKRKSLADGHLSIHAFNAALNACAHPAEGKTEKEKIHIFSKATAITNLIKEYKALPDDTTYGTMLRAASTLLPKRRQQIVDSLFRMACEEGVCGPMVLKQLKFATRSPELYALMLGLHSWVPPRGDVTVRDLPRTWSRNLRNGTFNCKER